MSNLYSIHPPRKQNLFYEVVEEAGESVWGGASASEALEWFYRAPIGARLLVSLWEDEDDLDSQPIGQAIDITHIIGAVRGGGR